MAKTLTPAQHKALAATPDDFGPLSVSIVHNGVIKRLIGLGLIEWRRPEWMTEVDIVNNRHAVWRLNYGAFRRTDKGREQLAYETPCSICGAVAGEYHQEYLHAIRK